MRDDMRNDSMAVIAEIARPRTLLIHIIQQLAKSGHETNINTLVRVCIEVQRQGSHIYSFATDPEDVFIQMDVYRDVSSCVANGWLRESNGGYSVTKVGAQFMASLIPSAPVSEAVDKAIELIGRDA